MGIKVNFLKVFNGDAIHISYIHNNKDINIVIDSGSSKAYEEEEKIPPYDIIDGEFKKLIEDLKEKKQVITLLILTHVDDDHIGGVLKWMESDKFNISLIERVWFNSGKLINQYLNINSNKNIPSLKLNIFKSLKTGISDGVIFEEKIKNILDKKLIKAGDIYQENEIGANFLILSPSKENLEKLLIKWEDEEPESLKTATTSEYKKTLKQLLKEDKLRYDSSIANGSSIAFILEIKNKKLLFLADCFHTTIINSMKKLKINSLDVDLVKISHHGSKYNTSNKLLKKINCKKYVISTNYSGGRPHKVTIARIINNNPNCEIYLNYKEELENKIFIPKDYKDYNFSIHSTKDLTI